MNLPFFGRKRRREAADAAAVVAAEPSAVLEELSEVAIALALVSQKLADRVEHLSNASEIRTSR